MRLQEDVSAILSSFRNLRARKYICIIPSKITIVKKSGIIIGANLKTDYAGYNVGTIQFKTMTSTERNTHTIIH
jgi:hypothetical protein